MINLADVANYWGDDIVFETLKFFAILYFAYWMVSGKRPTWNGADRSEREGSKNT